MELDVEPSCAGLKMFFRSKLIFGILIRVKQFGAGIQICENF